MNSSRCFLCGRNGYGDPLDRHHLIGGCYRSKSEKYGLVVFLCHSRCHLYGKEAAHRNAQTMKKLRRYAQIKVMAEQDWTEDEFRHEFGKSYLTQEDIDRKEDAIMLNRVVLQGRLVADPELRHTQSGTAVAQFRIACDRNRKSQDPNAQNADFITIVAWRGTAEFVCRYFQKGAMILVDGRLQARSYDDQNGQKRYVTEVVAESLNFAASKRDSGGQSSDYGQQNSYNQQGGYGQNGYGGSQYQPNISASDFTELEDDDGELPF